MGVPVKNDIHQSPPSKFINWALAMGLGPNLWWMQIETGNLHIYSNSNQILHICSPFQRYIITIHFNT